MSSATKKKGGKKGYLFASSFFYCQVCIELHNILLSIYLMYIFTNRKSHDCNSALLKRKFDWRKFKSFILVSLGSNSPKDLLFIFSKSKSSYWVNNLLLQPHLWLSNNRRFFAHFMLLSFCIGRARLMNSFNERVFHSCIDKRILVWWLHHSYALMPLFLSQNIENWIPSSWLFS